MLEVKNKTTIGFFLTDEFGNKYSQESTVDPTRELGETDLDVIGEQLNIFLKQCGYYRANNYIFMEDVTGEELAELAYCLDEMRGKAECDAECCECHHTGEVLS